MKLLDKLKGSEDTHDNRPNVTYNIHQKDSNNSPVTAGSSMNHVDIGSNKNNKPNPKGK